MSRPDLAAPADLSALLAPRSVAIVGASNDPTRIGGRPVHYYRQAGFAGALYPVNPNRDEVQGYKAYPDVASIPQAIDFALLAVPAERLIPSLEACADKGAKAAVIFTAGFAEIGEEGARRQEEIVAFARERGMRLLGPNCLGLFHARHGHCPTFSSALEGGLAEPGRVGFITQSGAYGTHLLVMARERRIGVNYWISTGNEADIGVADCLDFLAADPDTDVIACYMEGVKNRPLFLQALARARAAGKVVCMMKVGVSPMGAQAAASHTASLAGADDIFQATMEEFGVERCETTEEMLDIVYAASRTRLPRGRKLGILTISGGAGVLMADAAHRHGLAVPPMPEAAQKALLETNPLASARNPVDITAHAINDFGLVGKNLESMLTDGGYDMLVSFFTSWPASPVLGPKLRESLIAGSKGHERVPHALVVCGPPDTLTPYEDDGFILFDEPSRAVAALAALARIAEHREAGDDAPPPALPEPVPVIPQRAIGEFEAKEILRGIGFPVLPERLAATREEALAAAREVGMPVAMKIVSPDIAHKTEIGGVALGVADEAAVGAAFDTIMQNAAHKAPQAQIDGVLISPMVGEGLELIVGARCDPVMGPAIMVGLGGIYVEVMRDVVLARAPVSVSRAHDMLGRLKGAALLDGVRGQPAVDRAAAAEAIARLSQFAALNDGRFESIEINPLLVRAKEHEKGQGAVALDALITPVPGAGEVTDDR